MTRLTNAEYEEITRIITSCVVYSADELGGDTAERATERIKEYLED